MNMVQGKGVQYEGAIEQLRKTFSVPPAASSALNSSPEPQKAKKNPLRKSKTSPTPKSGTKKKKKGLKALTSMMKKNP